jgi:hypothetical protein
MAPFGSGCQLGYAASFQKPRSGEETPETKPTRSEELRKIIERYANDLRKIIKKLRRKMN